MVGVPCHFAKVPHLRHRVLRGLQLVEQLCFMLLQLDLALVGLYPEKVGNLWTRAYSFLLGSEHWHLRLFVGLAVLPLRTVALRSSPAEVLW